MGASITSLEVGVEDGDISHYSNFCGPAQWTMSIVAVARSHEAVPTAHGTTTGKAGTCPYVLRFEGPGQLANFEVGYSYEQPTTGHHDVHWKTSNGRQSGWTFPAGTGNGPVHAPVLSGINILLIVLDDVGTDKLSLYDGNQAPPYARTPRLDELAGAGVLFRNFYVNPVCSTTRACLQTGRYSFRHGVGALSAPDGLQDCEVTLAELLKVGMPYGSHYTSGAFGKWHVTPNEEASWSHAGDNGYDRFAGTMANTGSHFDWTKVVHEPPSAPDDVELYCIEPECAASAWSGNVVRADAVSWIRAQARPFLAYVGFNPPHYVTQVPPSTTQDAVPRPLLSNATLDDLDALGLSVGEGPGVPADPAKRDLIYRAMLEAVDSEIGYLIADLGSRMDDTMVFVVCDNGAEPELIHSPPHIQSHGKDSVYQLGVRVPMIVSGPLAATGEADALVGAVDLWSTIAEIAGADPVLALQGGCDSNSDSTSFLPVIQDPASAGDRPLAFSQLFTPTSPYTSVDDLSNHLRAVTDGRYKYIRTILGHSVGTPVDPDTDYAHEFFDLVADPDESDNLLLTGLDAAEQLIYQLLQSEMDSLSEF